MLDITHIHSEDHVYKLFGHEILVQVSISTLILATIGAAFLARYAISFIRLLAELLFIPGIPLKAFKAKSKDTKTYAIVTGCTAGIGLEFAKQLAQKGFGIVLVGRRRDALESVAQELESKYSAPSKIIVADATDSSNRSAALNDVERVLSEVDVGILVNNVGASHEMPTAFAETEPDEMDRIIATNVSWTLHLTRTVLPHLIKRSDPKINKKSTPPRSLILNIGSLSGYIPSALLATYSCTKGGLQTWTHALGVEVEPQGVVVRMIFPAFVVSGMSKIRRPSLTVPLPRDFVASTLSSIGLNRGAQFRPFMSTPYPAHALFDYIIGVTGSLGMWIAVKVVLGMHIDIRKRALKKKAREAKGK